MSKRIVYQIANNPVSIMIPCDCGLALEQIGHKDVPAGVPFWIVDAADIPSDRVFRDAWELDISSIGSPSGFGGAV